MYEHSYSCITCGSKIVLRSNKAEHPMMGKTGLHSSFSAKIEELSVYYGITRVMSGANVASRNCHGILRHNPTDFKEVTVVAPPPPPPATALTHSQDYARSTARGTAVNTVCAAFDTTTSRAKKGVNAHGARRATLNVALRTVLDRVEKLENWDTGNCAEIQAANKILNAGSAIANIRLHSRSLDGNPKPPCENCRGWLTPVPGGEYRIR